MKAFVRIPLVLGTLLLLLAAPASTGAALPRGDPGLASQDLLVLRTGNAALGTLIALPASGRILHGVPTNTGAWAIEQVTSR